MRQVLAKLPPEFLLIRGTPAEKELKELAEFASKEENWLRPGKMFDLESEESKKFGRHVGVKCSVGHDHTVHVLFTHTIGVLTNGIKTEEVRVRHASIAVDDHSSYPDPVQIFTVCKFLGFGGTLDDWHMDVHPHIEHTIVVVQPIESFNDKNVEFSMYFMKDGKKREEFHPVQDLAGDPKGQAQMNMLVKLIRLRRALEKTGMSYEAVQALMDIWNNRPLKNNEPVPVNELLTVPISLTEEEKEVFFELRKRLLGH